MSKSFSLVGAVPAQIYIDPKDTGYKGIRIAAEAFAKDVCTVTGKCPEIVTDPAGLHGPAIVVGTMDQNPLIKEAVQKGQLELSVIDGKWECYLTKTVEDRLFISGSDKRGCIYGIYRLSELIGVSPWVWFADVTPEKKEILVFGEEVETVSKEPSVKYRGVFINDESPSFTGWAYGKFGALNDKMYCHVFELILRLKGNYLWPAMWGNVFSEEGCEHPQDNIRVADEYGVVMGTSHHEPMCRAGEEWRHLWKQYTDKYNWDFAVNREGITEFWKDGIHRNKPYESVITVGMRGEADSALEGGLQYNIDLLKDIILTQKELLDADGLSEAPKMLVVYKEVEKYWNGDDVSEGLKDWKLPDGSSPLDDVVIMLCEDNYGNVRSLPVTDKLKNRKGGWGMYYHFDYNGGPRGYMWLNVMQLEKTWEQLSQTYDCGVRDIWIVNVGDLKPMEMQISYYMDLAYDFETYGTNGTVTPGEYYLQFVKQQFSYGVTASLQKRLANLLAGYSKLNAICKPEYMREHIYSIENYGEAARMLRKALSLMEEAEACRGEIPEALADAYEQLVYYPCYASANVVALYIYSAYNRYYAKRQDARANGYAVLTKEAIARDRALTAHYNEEMSGGKWNKMMSQPHLGYVAWNAENCAPPVPVYLENVTCEMTQDALIREILETPVMMPEGVQVLHPQEHCGMGTMSLKSGEQAQFKILPEYGRSKASAKVYPVSMEPGNTYDATGAVEGLPYLEYAFTADQTAEYTIRVYLAPSNHLDGDKVELRYGVSVDNCEAALVNALPKGYIAGDCFEWQWSLAVERNAHLCESKAQLTKGEHKLRFYGIDAGLVLQKIVVYRGELPESYLGPEENSF